MTGSRRDLLLRVAVAAAGLTVVGIAWMRGILFAPDRDGETDDTIVDEDKPPVERNGKLQVRDGELIGDHGDPVQLTGMSTHGIQWYGNCITNEAMDALAHDWESDLMRIAMYTDHRPSNSGYIHDQSLADDVVDMVDMCKERGLYAVIDWHNAIDGDPMEYVDEAEDFFADMARRYADDDHVIYEICNEPNGSQFDSDEPVDWDRIREYADRVIPAIRQYDGQGVIIIGTSSWASFGLYGLGTDERDYIIEHPYEKDDNILYSYHFYAGSHRSTYQEEIVPAFESLPVIVTEWGSMRTDGDAPNDFDSSEDWVECMAERGVSWIGWNYSDDKLESGVYEPGVCAEGNWDATDRLTDWGEWVSERIRSR